MFRDRTKTIVVITLFLLVTSCRRQERQFISSRLESVDAVARIEVVEEYGGSAYHYVRAKVIKVFKNRTSQSIESEIGIGYLGVGNGIPIDRECTVYLIGVLNSENIVCWYLDESDTNATDQYSGFSHSSRSKIEKTKTGQTE